MDDVTVGIPVYNESKYIQKTLHSIDGQAGHICISDNASTDGTSAICQDFASTRPYVHYHRFEENQGAMNNFTWCLDAAKTKYFMFVGGHDMIEENHVSNLYRTLTNSDAICAYANAIHLDKQYTFLRKYNYQYADYLRSDDVFLRLFAIAYFLTDCTIFHGLYIKNIFKFALKQVYHERYCPIDHVVLMDMAKIGKMVLCNDSRYIRITPRYGNRNQLASWTRVMQAMAGKTYDPALHSPLLFPHSVYTGQMNILRSLIANTKEDAEVLELATQAVATRWGGWLQKK